jgi:hypothetical protein
MPKAREAMEPMPQPRATIRDPGGHSPDTRAKEQR